MYDVYDLVQEDGYGLPHDLRDVHEILDLDGHEYDVNPPSGDHDLWDSVTSRHILLNDHSSKLAVGHLQKVSNVVEGLFKLESFHVVFVPLCRVIVFWGLGLVWFLQRVIRKSLYDSYLLLNWYDDYLFGVILENERGGCEYDASEDSRGKLQLSLRNLLLSCVDADIGYKVIAVNVIIQALLWSVCNQIQL